MMLFAQKNICAAFWAKVRHFSRMDTLRSTLWYKFQCLRRSQFTGCWWKKSDGERFLQAMKHQSSLLGAKAAHSSGHLLTSTWTSSFQMLSSPTFSSYCTIPVLLSFANRVVKCELTPHLRGAKTYRQA